MKARFRRFQAGADILGQLTASRMNEVLQALEERTPETGFGTSLKTGPSGFSYSASQGTRASAVTLPFTVKAAGDEEVRVTSGHVQYASTSFIPTIEGTALNGEDVPTITLQAEQNVYLKARGFLESTATTIADGVERYVIGELVGFPTFEIIAGPKDLRGKVAFLTETETITYWPLATRESNGTITQFAWGPFTAETAHALYTEYPAGVQVSYNGHGFIQLTPASVTIYS